MMDLMMMMNFSLGRPYVSPVAIRCETVVVAAEKGITEIRVSIDDVAIHQATGTPSNKNNKN